MMSLKLYSIENLLMKSTFRKEDFMHELNKVIGDIGEEIAKGYLEKNNYMIIERNFRCKLGEVDMIAKDEKYFCFIEVKTRHGTYYGTPAEAVNHIKQHKIIMCAQFYILKMQLFEKFNYRFDVVEIVLNKSNKVKSIKLIKNAFY
jgi:putative endonuclease